MWFHHVKREAVHASTDAWVCRGQRWKGHKELLLGLSSLPAVDLGLLFNQNQSLETQPPPPHKVYGVMGALGKTGWSLDLPHPHKELPRGSRLGPLTAHWSASAL